MYKYIYMYKSMYKYVYKYIYIYMYTPAVYPNCIPQLLAASPSIAVAQGDVYSGGGSGHIHGSNHHLTTVLEAPIHGIPLRVGVFFYGKERIVIWLVYG